jgi:type IV/VI secretion system ImpK/VasF family protein
MTTILDELQANAEQQSAVIIPYLQNRGETIDEYIASSVTYSNPTTQFLFSGKMGSHLPESGLNPLVDASAYLFFLIGKIKRVKEHHDLARLHHELITEVREFQERILACHYSDKCLSEYIPTATFALCVTLDELISETSWGGEGRWREFSILSAIYPEMPSQEGFLLILERLILDPDVYIDVMEFMYICLSFGFKCRSEVSSFALKHDQHVYITNALYKFIQSYRGNATAALSPYPIKPKRVVLTHSAKLRDAVKSMMRNMIIFRRKPAFSAAPSLDHIQAKQIKSLRSRYHGAMNFIKKTRITLNQRIISLDNLPWFFLIGSQHSGKTSLLSKSNINFIREDQSHRNNHRAASASSSFDWWVTPGSVLVDVPGSYMATQHNDANVPTSHPVWQYFLKLMLNSKAMVNWAA